MMMTTLANLASETARWRALFWLFVAIALLLASISVVLAGPREQAWRMHSRLAGVPPSAEVLEQMRALIAANNATGAAMLAMQNPHFYTVTLKNFAAPWTNRDQSPFVPLNDYTTLVIGMVKDNLPFNRILFDDLLYVGASVTPAPSASSNAHYENLEQAMLAPGFNPVSGLTQTTQSATYGLPQSATAGAMTTRAAAEAFFIAGTNRAMLRFTLMNHLCVDLEQLHDNSVIPDRIRQDVSRGPGGDSRVFLNNCIGCHAGMDPLAQAFAYYDFNDTAGAIEYTAGAVQPKYFLNEDTFADGFVTPDDSWANYWRQGQNALLGWDGSLPGSGSGAKSLGQELAGTQVFAQCQVRKVFNTVCLRDPVDGSDRDRVSQIAQSFRNGGYNLRQVFADTAAWCMGE
jgi:hypothetical protein